MPVNLDQIRSFRLAAELESFTEAASEQRLSQPAVSLQIRQLERELGVTLFERNGRRIKLTEAGGLFLEYARDVESLTTNVRRELQRVHAGAYSVSIGCSPTSARHYVPLILAQLRTTRPDIHVRVSVLPTDQAAAALARAEVDFVFTTDASGSSRFVFEPCFESRLYVVAPAGHELASRGRVSAEELARYPFALLPPPYRGPELFAHWAESHGVEIKVVLEIGNYDGMIEAVRRGTGLALISETASAEDVTSGRLAIVRAPGLPIEFQVYLGYRAGALTPAAEAFRGAVMDGAWRAGLPRLGGPGPRRAAAMRASSH